MGLLFWILLGVGIAVVAAVAFVVYLSIVIPVVHE